MVRDRGRRVIHHQPRGLQLGRIVGDAKRERLGRDAQVQEPRPGDLDREVVEPRGHGIGQLARRAPKLLGELHREVRLQVEPRLASRRDQRIDARLTELTGKRYRRMGRFMQLALTGAVEAAKKSRLELPPSRTGVFLATGLGNISDLLPFSHAVFGDPGCHVSAIQFASSVGNAGAFFIAQALGLTGPVMAVSQDEVSFEAALMQACALIDKRYGEQVLKLFEASEHGRALRDAGFGDDLTACAAVDAHPVIPLYSDRQITKLGPDRER